MPKRPRTVAIATETRAEYGLLRPVYRAVEKRAGLRAVFIASGMHHLKRFGHTIETIRADGVRVREIRTARRGGDPGADAGRAVAKYAEALAGCDWLIVLGDRVEMLSAATAATAVGVPLTHIHGGDVAPGARDDAIRHAITKLAHLHFPATDDAARRIRKMGEQPWRITVAGAPAVDAIAQARRPGKVALDKLAGFDTDESFALVSQHAAGFSPAAEQQYLKQTLAAVAERVARAIVVGPGLDAGSERLHGAIEKFTAGRSGWTFVRSLEQGVWFALLERAAVLVGNSSSGIIEAGHFCTPVVNVGPRQAGRLAGRNVLHADYGRASVGAMIGRALADAAFRRTLARFKHPYGQGRAGETIARVLSKTPIDRKLLVKQIAY